MTLADELSSGMVILDEEVYQEVTEVGCGECATAYSAVTMTGEAVVLKVFDAGKRASPMDSRSIYNHYGKTRDVSRQVFEEIRTKCAEHPFLLKFFRIAARESCWILIMERAMGIPLTEFIEINRSEPEVLSKASNELGKHL